MRAGVILLTVACALALAAPGDAQFTPGLGPRPIKFQQIDTSRAVQAGSTQKYFGNPATSMPSFSLGSFFRKLTGTSYTPKVASTPVLTPDKNPFQPNPPRGQTLFPQGQPKGKSIFDSVSMPFSR